MATSSFKKNYRCIPSLQQFYTGGSFAVSSDGTFIACACDEKIRIVDSSNASIKSTIEGDSEQVTALVLSPDDKLLFSASHSRQIRVWDLSTLKCLRSWKIVANASSVYPKDPEAPQCGVDDMTKLAYLHEPGVLQNLRSRYDINEIYTYTGSILIAVNPFRRLPHLYDKFVMEQYKGAALGELSPHPFAVADAAYRVMINEGISQSILVSGESGAGKTESTKMLMRYLAYMGGRAVSEGLRVLC